MYCMKRLALLFSCSAMLVSAADLAGVRNVYVLKMPKGLDQYLANRLTNEHVFQIVTDPALADTILTDQIGENFQAKLEELYPPPPPPQPVKPAEPEKPANGKKSAADEETSHLMTDTVNKLARPNNAFNAGKGMVFLVDAKSKAVIWSALELPKDSSVKELDRTASGIVA